MKPIRLEIEAFGAFATKQVIDFEIFEQSRLFLIHGPTGSGKTTLFDAMTYALYGETTSAREGKSMRSDYAEKDVKTHVHFIFKIAMQVYKVERLLYLNNKDEPITKQNFCEVTWNELKKEYQEASTPITKITEIKAEVEKILGFNAQQFKQIVILPQGKFQELLIAPTSVKEQILIQIFGAEVYEKITESLNTKSKLFKKQLDDMNARFQTQLQGIGQESIPEAQNHLQARIQELQTFKGQTESLLKITQNAQQVYQSALQQQENFQHKVEAENLLQQHEQQSTENQTQQTKLEQSENAEPFRADLNEMEGIKKDITSKDAHAQTVDSRLISYQAKQVECAKSLENLENQAHEIKEKQQKIEQLEKLKPKYEEKEILETKLTQSKKQKEESELEIKQTELKIQENKKEIDGEIYPEIEQLSTLAQKEDFYKAELSKYQAWEKQRKDLKELRGQYAQLDTQLKEAQINLENLGNIRLQKSTAYDELDTRWRKNQATVLAMPLHKDSSLTCPVCGSTEHPNLAQSNEKTVSDQDLEKAKKERTLAEANYDKAKTEYDEVSKQANELKVRGVAFADQLGDIKDKAEEVFKKELEEIENALAAAQNAQKALKLLKEKLQELKQQTEKLENKLNQLRSKLEIQTQKFNQENTDFKVLLSQLPKDETLKDEKTIDKFLNKAYKEIQKYKEDLEKLNLEKDRIKETISKQETEKHVTLRDLKELASRLDDKERKLARDLKKRSFNSLKEMQASLLSEAERQTLRNTIDTWKSRQITLKANLEQISKKLKDQLMPEIKILEDDKIQKEQHLEQHREQITQLETQIKDLQNRLQKIELGQKELEKLEAQAEHTIYLYDLANGGNALKQKFQTYVLSVFLDEVVQYANKRLAFLSQERYQLFRTDVVKGGGKKGLDLKVFDSYSGGERMVDHLSGGETFFTSLALALGLADVATANAGGIRLDSMFIDEGFGTLDSETLDLAIQTLMNLDGEHRLVGIISHVSELKERISSSRLEIMKGKRGSQVKVHAG